MQNNNTDTTGSSRPLDRYERAAGRYSDFLCSGAFVLLLAAGLAVALVMWLLYLPVQIVLAILSALFPDPARQRPGNGGMSA